MRSLLAVAAASVCVLALSAPAGASSYVRYGIQDDAWLAYGPGTVDERVDTLDRMGVKLVRYTLRLGRDRAGAGTRATGTPDADPRAASTPAGSVPVVTL